MPKQQVGFLVSAEVKRKLRVIAARQSLTMAEYVRRLVEESVKEEPDPQEGEFLATQQNSN